MNRLHIKLKNHKHPSDVTLVVKDGKEFQAHRSVLSQASSFFEKLLDSDMKESNEGVIRLEIVSEFQMADILEFIYTGSVQISTQENAENLFQLADYLLLSDLKAFAGKCLEEHITTTNCVSIYFLAEKYLCQDLIASCRKFIHSNFSSVAAADDFLNLTSVEVENWISSDEIVIDAEENVFELVLRWIDHDKSQRRVKFRDLFRHVRLTCISRDFIANDVMTNDLVKENEECLESVYLALQWYDRSTDCDIPRPHPPRKALERDVIVVTVCGGEHRLFHTSFYLPSTEQWYRLPSTSCEPSRLFSYRGKVFIVAKNITRSQCYDPDLNRWFPAPWTKLDSNLAFMKLNRTSWQIHDVLVTKDEICFIVEERHSVALWRYNVDLNSMTPLFHWAKKESFCAVVVGRQIYVIGGNAILDNRYNQSFREKCSISDSSTYDTEEGFWREIAPLKEARRNAFGVSKNQKHIFIAGGIGDCNAWLNSCEVYSIAANEWQFISSLTVPRAYGKMVSIDETLYVLGGRVKKPSMDSRCFPDSKVPVECYDHHRDKWIDRTTMSIDKVTFEHLHLPRPTEHRFWLKICSVRIFNHFSSNSTRLLPFN